MKRIATLFLVLFSFSILSYSQSKVSKDILINKVQEDDVYLAGETIEVNAAVNGDLVAAGGKLMLHDIIQGDIIGAGGELSVRGQVFDDVRIAGGKVTIDSDIGDDLVVFGGEVFITEGTRINGRLVCFAGDVTVNGEVMEEMDVRGGDISINGTIRGDSKIIGEDINVGSNAQFFGDVEYWNSDGEMDFQNSLVNANAQFNQDLRGEKSQLSITTFGTRSYKLWIYYIFSAFLVILVLHALFRNAFAGAVEGLNQNLLKSFGVGLIYLIGIPLLILIAFLMIIGIPLGLFATGVFIFSLLFGHLIAALLIVYYWRTKKGKDWGFWSITFLALLCAIILRVLTIIPFAGILLSVVILSVTYGALSLKVIRTKIRIAQN